MTAGMDDEALRAIVRETLARLQSGSASPAAEPSGLRQLRSHSSHYQYALPPSGGPCLIEPDVQCTHCGYCQSHGH